MKKTKMQEFINRRDAAYNHFDNAVGEYEVDMAIHEIIMAELAMKNYVMNQRAKENKEEEMEVAMA